MSQKNITIKVKTILLSVCILSSVGLFAQSEKAADKSTIVMTKSELNSFLKTVADARRAQLKERESRSVKSDLAELRLKYEHGSGMRNSNFYEDGGNQQVMRELRYLNDRINSMNSGNSGSMFMPQRGRDNSTIIMPGNSGSSQSYAPNPSTAATILPANSMKIDELQAKIDSLRTADANKSSYVQNNSYTDSLNTLKGNLANIQREMARLEAKMKADKSIVSPETSKSYFKQQVYFANNSEALNAEYLKYVQDLTQVLITYPEAKVLLEGWASPVGKADYNKRLSMRRSEAVQKAFLNNGIDKSRILTSFKGEDKLSSDQHARRVDMSIIVK